MARSPNSNRRRLGRELKRAREALGISQTQVASVLKCMQAKINRVEATVVEIQPDELDKMMNMYELLETRRQELREVHAHADVPRALPGSPRRTEEYRLLVDLEPEAHTVLAWHSERIPEPLQSNSYALQQVTWDKPKDSVFATSVLAGRKARRLVFTVDPAPLYHAVLSESSLLRPAGGRSPQRVLNQAQHLIDLMDEHPTCCVQLLEFEAKLATAQADFTLLRFNESTENYTEPADFVYLEHLHGAQVVEEKKSLDLYQAYWDQLTQAALSPKETRAYLENLIDFTQVTVRRAHALPAADE